MMRLFYACCLALVMLGSFFAGRASVKPVWTLHARMIHGAMTFVDDDGRAMRIEVRGHYAYPEVAK
jgi:hypothetical protein